MFKGVIGKLVCTDKGTYKRYSMALKGQDGWHSLGFEPPPSGVSEGTCVEFSVTKNQKGYDEVDRTSIRVLAGEEAVAAQPVATVAANGGGFKKFGAGRGNFGKSQEEKDYWAKREARELRTQRTIELQSCRNSAIALVEILLKPELGAIELPKKTSGKEEAIWLMVQKYTQDFVNQNFDHAETGPESSAKTVEKQDQKVEEKKNGTDDLGW